LPLVSSFRTTIWFCLSPHPPLFCTHWHLRRENYHKNLGAYPVIYVGMSGASNSTRVMDFAHIHTSHPTQLFVTASMRVITTRAQTETDFYLLSPAELAARARDHSHHPSPPSHLTVLRRRTGPFLLDSRC
jgi:hypothetical protein